MITYWVLFFLAAGFALIAQTRVPVPGDNIYSTRLYSEWIFFILVLTILIGFRFEVGGDWYLYNEHNIKALNSTLSSSISRFGDPGYFFLNWIRVKCLWGQFFMWFGFFNRFIQILQKLTETMVSIDCCNPLFIFSCCSRLLKARSCNWIWNVVAGCIWSQRD